MLIAFYSCGQSSQEYSSGFFDYGVENSIYTVEEKQADNPEAIERKVIKNGDLNFRTKDINKTKDFILLNIQQLDAYISNENTYNYSDRLEHRLTVRVPADKFDLLLNNISKSADKLDSKNINLMDVTEEYVDIEARLKAKKNLQSKYLDLLEQATKVEEILNIEKEIGNLQAEIESIEGRAKYLKDRISYSTLTITYYQKTTSAFGFSSKFIDGLKNG